jgi:hypothetical protein
MLNSLPVSVLRIAGIWKHARHRREVMTRNSAAMAAWFVLML